MNIDKQAIIAAFQFRHACKAFDDQQKISDEDFAFILETARLSPSSFGLEPWKFLVLQNSELREKLKPYVWGGQKQIPTASHLVLALVRKSVFMRFDSDYVQNFMREVQVIPEETAKMRTGIIEKFQREDFDLLSSERTMTDWACKQTYIPMANMMTVAAMLGIDTCPIEGFEQTGVQKILQQELAVDFSQWGLGYLLAFGYRKTAPAREKTRQALAAVVEWVK